jgi:hypothetical protein
MAMAGNKIQIGGDLQCREAQTQISIFSLFDHKFILQYIISKLRRYIYY